MSLEGYPPIFHEAAKFIRPVNSILDIGPGIRPQAFFDAEAHICIEPHGEYVDWLERNGYRVITGPVLSVLPYLMPVDTIFLLDVIEHMDKGEGLEVLAEAHRKARNQIVVYTPLGFYPQYYVGGDKDAWGMNGVYWQTHRSGWEPYDFPGWKILVDPDAASGQGAFFAIFGA